MDIKKSSKLLFILFFLWVSSLLTLGAWWFYLLVTLNDKLKLVGGKLLDSDLLKMLIWEGGSFIVLLLLLSITMIFIYIKDQRKTKALQAFFASLTHELKTPLASIRLQADVMDEKVSQKEDETLKKLSSRLIEDTARLEVQMDKILQLSRLERGGDLNPTPINLNHFLKHILKEWGQGLDFNLQLPKEESVILADEFALELILKNLIENTKGHAHSNQVNIIVNPRVQENLIEFIYSDGGQYHGEQKRLGTLFYKYDSTKGSGIGLYLSKRLMQKMHGKLSFEFSPSLKSILSFKVPTGEQI